MISAIASREFKQNIRSGVFIAIAATFIFLLFAASALSIQRVSAFERERVAAQTVDRNVWDAQGDRNPHSAAHFSRYAFKPIPAFTAFDPGVTDYAGLAVWMEAHIQNPAAFRRAEDLGDAGRIASLSPAWILQFAAPLFIFLTLYGSIAGEREAGTLRQITASGVRAQSFFAGKLAGAGASLGLVIIPALILALIAANTGAEAVLPDPALRIAGLALAYFIFLTATGALAIGVSALFSEKRGALLTLAALWTASFVLMPRLAADAALTAYPEPPPSQLEEELKAASNAYYKDAEYREAEDKRILAEYGVQKIEDLPIDYGAFTLQSSEEHANPLFDAYYARLNVLHEKQERVLSTMSAVSPVLALNALSSGLSGTDRIHQTAFVKGAEDHRRKIVKQLNEDLMYNAGEAGHGYTADEALWRSIEDFTYDPPSFISLWSRYAPSVFTLLVYFITALVFAGWSVTYAQKRIVS